MLIPVPDHQKGRGVYSPLFLIRKPNGSFRAIINLKSLNQAVVYKKFKMETISSTINLLREGSFMASIDLQDAYYHVPIHKSSQQYLRIAVFLGSELFHFQFQALPFGLASAPRIFTKVMSEIMAFFHHQEILIIPYLDDFLIAGPSASSVRQDLDTVARIFSSLGWLINLQKSDLEPGQAKIFLGILLDSNLQTSFLPAEKQMNIQSQISSLIASKTCSIRKVMSILGLLTSSIPAVKWSQAHSRSLQSFLLSSWDGQQSSLDRKVKIPSWIKRSLLWWKEVENLQSGVPWIQKAPVVVTTDASSKGWGAHTDSQWLQGAWPKTWTEASSNLRELAAVWEALKELSPALQGKDVRILSDNTTTVAYLNKQGGTKCRSLCRLTAKIFAWAEGNIRSLSAVHLKGIDNIAADFLSRITLQKGEWSLNPDIFAKITEKFGLPQIDLFASSQNHQVQAFYSLCHKDRPLAVDAFSQPWSQGLLYAFPPFSLIPRVLMKIQRDKAKVILIAPFWPKRSWFPILLQMAKGNWWSLPLAQDLLFQGPIRHPTVSQLHLTAWMLKGRP